MRLIILSIVCVLVTGIANAAQEVPTIAGNIINDGIDHTGGVIVITSTPFVLTEICGNIWFEYPCVINETDGTITITTCEIEDTLVVVTGDQFDILSQTECFIGQPLNLVLTPHVTVTGTVCHIPPGNAESARTLEVSTKAVNAHLAHGDSLDACP